MAIELESESLMSRIYVVSEAIFPARKVVADQLFIHFPRAGKTSP